MRARAQASSSATVRVFLDPEDFNDPRQLNVPANITKACAFVAARNGTLVSFVPPTCVDTCDQKRNLTSPAGPTCYRGDDPTQVVNPARDYYPAGSNLITCA